MDIIQLELSGIKKYYKAKISNVRDELFEFVFVPLMDIMIKFQRSTNNEVDNDSIQK